MIRAHDNHIDKGVFSLSKEGYLLQLTKKSTYNIYNMRTQLNDVYKNMEQVRLYPCLDHDKLLQTKVSI